MAELFYQHPHYQLLLNTHRRGWCPFDKTTFTITCIVTVPMIIFCTIYVLLFGVYETVVYPKNFNSYQVPRSWTLRATQYSASSANASVMPYPTTTTHRHAPRPPHAGPAPGDPGFKLVCYYNFPEPSDYDSGGNGAAGAADLLAYKIDPGLCTHINVANAVVRNDSVYVSAVDLKTLEAVVQLKKFNKRLKVMLTVGGFGEDDGFARMVYNHTSRKTFIRSVLYYVRTYRVDGIDLDWEFPNDLMPGGGGGNGDRHQVMHFTQLIEELRIARDRQARHRFLVSVAVAAPALISDTSYDIGPMSRFVDWVNLMTYDYHFFTKYTPFTGLNAPLYPLASERGYLATLNTNYSANHWQTMGMDRSKIVIGLPTYGHTFSLTNTRNNRIYAPSNGYGKLGYNGFVDYSQICNFLYANQIAPVFETDAKSPYATKGNEWISFEDEQSLLYKAEYIRDNSYGGAMVFSLNADDHKGLCRLNGRPAAGSSVTFPLTRTIHRVLFGPTRTP